jgi:hypothetical protein
MRSIFASVGLALALVGFAAQQANASDAQFQQAFRNCLRNRGYSVLN